MLFADLSGYTAVAERLDPESVKRQLERILGRLGEEVVAYGGHVDKFIGDNVMAIFGAPVAHGDDAERAVRAGLGMQAAMGEVNEPLAAQHGVTFELCVGINTGEVLAGHVGDSYTVIGDTVNVAARLQAAARPGSVTVGEAHLPRDARGDRLPRAGGAAGAEGQDRAGARVGGAGRGRQAGGGRLGCGARRELRWSGRAAELAAAARAARAGRSAGAARIW